MSTCTVSKNSVLVLQVPSSIEESCLELIAIYVGP